MSALAGLFSKQATDKLKEVFDTLFRAAPGQGDALREDKPEGSGPAISELVPSAVSVGAPPTVQVKGRGFVDGSTVCVGGASRTTQFDSSEQLTATLDAADTAQAGTLSITVQQPDGATSLAVDLTVA
jgi:hypothetical protein